MNDLDRTFKLLAAAEGSATATTCMIQIARNGGAIGDEIAASDTLTELADSTRLVIECLPELEDDAAQLLGAVIRFLEDRA